MIHLKKFITSMEAASQEDPMMQRWLYGLKELRHELLEKVINLCKYPEAIPKELLPDYVDVLVDALKNELSEEGGFNPSDNLFAGLILFAKRLKNSNVPWMIEKGEWIRKNNNRGS